MDTGEEKITDEGLIAQLRSRAKLVHRRALITAIIATLVTVAFP